MSTSDPVEVVKGKRTTRDFDIHDDLNSVERKEKTNPAIRNEATASGNTKMDKVRQM